MTKKLKKASLGTAAITSFFVSKSPKVESEPEVEICEVVNAGSETVLEILSSSSDEEESKHKPDVSDPDSDWEDGPKPRRSKRLRKCIKYSETEEESAPSPKVARRENGRASKPNGKVFPLFAGRNELINGKSKASPAPPPAKVVDADVLAFLKSGVNAITLKAQKLNECKRDEEEVRKHLDLFPVISHVFDNDSKGAHAVCDHGTWQSNLKLSLRTSYEDEIEDIFSNDAVNSYLDSMDHGAGFSGQKTICCGVGGSQLEDVHRQEDLDSSDDESGSDRKYLPWIVKRKVKSKTDLAVDPENVAKVYDWLKRWKRSISNDNGKSRQFVDKKKRNSDSEEEEDEMEAKALVLSGPTGCGKTATVVTLAEQLNFKVVEVNFSTARSGKDVLKRVEEATLSHRLQAGQDCLLLFEDISLVHPKDDEGFVSAVAQLITASCRPIVMTLTTMYDPVSIGASVAGECDSMSLDLKLIKKDPLYVQFNSPDPRRVLKKAILPIIKDELLFCHVTDELQAELDSVVRHYNGDIRRSINETQFLMMKYKSGAKLLRSFHSHLSPTIDLWFLRKDSVVKQQESTGKSQEAGSTGVVLNQTRKNPAKDKQDIESLCNLLNCMATYDNVITSLELRQHNEDLFDEDIRTGRAIHLAKCFSDSIVSTYDRILFHGTTPHSKVEVEDNKGRNQDTAISASTSLSSETPVFDLSHILFESDQNLEMDLKAIKLQSLLEAYCNTETVVGACGLNSYEDFACVRTIVKVNTLNSVGTRNRRQRNYFNCVGQDLIPKICETFDFKQTEAALKCASRKH